MHPRRPDGELFFSRKEMGRIAVAVVQLFRLRYVLFFDKDNAPQQVATGKVFGHGDMGGHAK
jgi:hypothetical protein